MKHFTLLFSALLLTAVVSATDLTGKYIYLNPGHGSWGPNDRPCATIPYPNLSSTGRPDTCGFYESNTDLWKVEELAKRLRAAGATVTMSRTKNGPYPYTSSGADATKYNRNLSEICEEVEQGYKVSGVKQHDYDYFLSVHSNAHTDGSMTNYPLFIYKGYDKSLNKSPSYIIGDSPERAEKMWPYLFEAMDQNFEYHSLFSKTNSYCKGDITFYGSMSARYSATAGGNYWGYLGVLKHGCAGFLSEGFFHTYQPARHRALNRDYCRMEGIRYYRGIVAYYNATPDTKGYIMGAVKDKTKSLKHDLYTYKSGTHDAYYPLNGVKVTLYKDGVKVDEYLTDNNYNGVFCFFDLEPGNYTLNATKQGYADLAQEYKATITVKANETTYPIICLEEGTASNFEEPDQDDDVTLSDSYAFRTIYSDFSFAELTNKTIRRAILKNDTALYVLALDNSNAPYLYRINPQNKEVTTLSTAGCSGNKMALSDIALTADGVLIGCNYGENWFDENHSSDSQLKNRGTLYIYSWTDESSAPQTLLSTQFSTYFYTSYIGETLAVSGTLNNCQIITTSASSQRPRIRLAVFTIKSGALTSTIDNEGEVSVWDTSVLTQVRLSPSLTSSANFILTSSAHQPIDFKLNATDRQAPTTTATATISLTGANYFRYAGSALAVVPRTSNGSNSGAALYNLSSGINNATMITTTGTALTAQAITYATAAVVVNNKDMNLYLLRDGSLTYLTTKEEEKPLAYGIYAYDLSLDVEDDILYKFSFKSNADATAGELRFYDAATDTLTGTVSLSDIHKGDNLHEMFIEDIPILAGQTVRWAVNLTAEQVQKFGTIYSETARYNISTGNDNFAFNTINTNPKSQYFGKTYVFNQVQTNGSQNGLYVYDPQFALENTTAYTAAKSWYYPRRMGIDSEGYLYIPDWSDAQSGIYMLDPSNLNAAALQLFSGERDEATGLITNNGQQVGGSSPAAAVYGSGANTLLYVYSEDTDPKNSVVTYQLGQADGSISRTWDAAPTHIYPLVGQANTNAELVVCSHGFFVSQHRSYGQNTNDAASLLFYDNDGTLRLESYEQPYNAYIDGSAGAGMALSADESRFVINGGSNALLVFQVSWTADSPTLTLVGTYKHTMGDIRQMTFDYAGNLVCTGAAGMFVYAIPTDNNIHETPAREQFIISKPKDRFLVEFYESNDASLPLQSSEWENGTLPTYTGTIPTIEQTDKYTFSFRGWSPEISAVDGEPQLYIADYDSIVRKYNIHFCNYDGTELQTVEVDYDSIPKYTGAEPERTEEGKTYTFMGWTQTPLPVTGEATYTARFSEAANIYTIRFENYDGSLLAETKVEYKEVPKYNGEPTREADERYEYYFIGWSPAIQGANSDQTYRATYSQTPIQYNIRFVNYDGRTLQDSWLTYEQMPEYTGSTPEREQTAQYTYQFTGWDNPIVAVTGAATYTATYDPIVRKYEIDFYVDDELMQDDEFEYGVYPEYKGEEPTRQSTDQYKFRFAGWGDVQMVTSQELYIAQFDTIVREYTITFLNYDGTVLQRTDVPYGNMPTYDGAEPFRAADSQYSYSFSGFSPAITEVTAAKTYVAQFNATPVPVVPTSLEIGKADLQVAVREHTLYVYAPSKVPMYLYSVGGTLIAQTSSTDYWQVPLPQAGVYILRCGNAEVKVHY